MSHTAIVVLVASIIMLETTRAGAESYTIVDTGQVRCYDDRAEIAYPHHGDLHFGQDAQYDGKQPAYRDNEDGTVTDLNTGLIWQADPGGKQSLAEAVAGARACRTGGYDDWRLPSIKELYSLIQFSGTDPDPSSRDSSRLRPFIDPNHFHFRYGRQEEGDRIIDSQWATSTLYVAHVMHGTQAMFGINFADGRIKGYPAGQDPRGRTKTFFAIYVRGNPDYGTNDFVDNGDGTVTDRATCLTWMKTDSAALKAGRNGDGRLNWREALEWAENLEYAGHSDWRLPNAKELHSIVDYSRSPDTTNSAAIDPVFEATAIENEGGDRDFGCYWSSTTHARVNSASDAVCIAFGRALGYMSPPGEWNGRRILLDVHGAGAQRADIKSGDPSRLPQGRGPQGDVMRIYNLVRCVRGGVAEPRTSGPDVEMQFVSQARERFGEPPNRREGQGDPPQAARGNRPLPAEEWVRFLDTNRDGKVSRAEFDGPGRHFTDFDRNRDGYISAEEAPTGPPPNRR